MDPKSKSKKGRETVNVIHGKQGAKMNLNDHVLFRYVMAIDGHG